MPEPVIDGDRARRQVWKLSLLLSLAGPAAAQQPFQFFLELAHVLEVAVDRCEADVSHSIQALQLLHDEFADFACRPLPFRSIHQKGLRGVHDSLEFAGRDGAFFAGAEQAAEHLLAVEALAAAVFLDHHVGDFVDALVGGEAAIAALALAAAADGIGLLALPRVDDPVLTETAIGTFHLRAILRHGCANCPCRAQAGAQGTGTSSVVPATAASISDYLHRHFYSPGETEQKT